MSYQLTISVLSPWHAGSGRGDGPLSDALTIRDLCGLPFVPGKTLKGLIRDAVQSAEDLGHCPNGFTAQIFGDHAEEGVGGIKRFGATDGKVILSDATLSPRNNLKQLRSWAQSHPAELDTLFTNISSTALEEGRLVKTGSLRSIEFVRPVTLYASLEGVSAEEAALIKLALPLLRAFGLRRNRGFGACEVTMEKCI